MVWLPRLTLSFGKTNGIKLVRNGNSGGPIALV